MRTSERSANDNHRPKNSTSARGVREGCARGARGVREGLVAIFRGYRARVFFAGANPDHAFDRQHKDFAVTHIAGAGGVDDGAGGFGLSFAGGTCWTNGHSQRL